MSSIFTGTSFTKFVFLKSKKLIGESYHKSDVLVTIRKFLLQHIITSFDSRRIIHSLVNVVSGFLLLKGLFVYSLNKNMPMHPYTLNSCR